MNCLNILGVNVAVTNFEESVRFIENNIESLKQNYICVCNVYTIVYAYNNNDYCHIQNDAALRLPDGKPLSIVQKNNGFKDAERVTGPSLMLRILQDSKDKNYRHVFFGSTNDTLEKMKTKVVTELGISPSNCLFISPAFSKECPTLTKKEIAQINKFMPTFIWVGLGAPKQEIWMAKNAKTFSAVSIGVGAAFDYLAGNIKRAPRWMQRLSLEWLYRLIQNPRLFRKYWKSNTSFLKLTKNMKTTGNCNEL
jgi:N-acetylglucosaminyldiphosphoundecaprenol N-acetyl-beta-D-mannosaminyltransferase